MKFIYCILHSCSPLFRKHLTFSILFSFVLCLLFPFSIAIAQGDENLLNRCWSVEQLKGKIKEVRSKRRAIVHFPPKIALKFLIR